LNIELEFIVFWKTIAFGDGSLKRAPMALTCPWSVPLTGGESSHPLWGCVI